MTAGRINPALNPLLFQERRDRPVGADRGCPAAPPPAPPTYTSFPLTTMPLARLPSTPPRSNPWDRSAAGGPPEACRWRSAPYGDGLKPLEHVGKLDRRRVGRLLLLVRWQAVRPSRPSLTWSSCGAAGSVAYTTWRSSQEWIASDAKPTPNRRLFPVFRLIRAA